MSKADLDRFTDFMVEYKKEIIKEYEKELDKFRPFTGAYEMKKEIERLNNIINEFNNVYSKVITKCNQMINSRYYMNENAIKKYATEIKDICYFYVEEAKELKGS